MGSAEREIMAMVDAETAAWNHRDADALVALFHPDAVWPWPPSADAHDPMEWVMPYGRFTQVDGAWRFIFQTGLLDYRRLAEANRV
jgi:ketosteroid isomerase-like protein